VSKGAKKMFKKMFQKVPKTFSKKSFKKLQWDLFKRTKYFLEEGEKIEN